MSDTTLKPCPFCGSQCFFNHEDATDARGDEYVRAWVECTGCDMRSIAKRAAYGIPAVKVMLAELWNRRVTTHQAVDVDAICNAYESGVGHRGRPTANVNPYREGTPEHEAYAIGAKGEAAQAEAKVVDETPESVIAAYKAGLTHGREQPDYEFEFASGSASDTAYAIGYNEGYEQRLASATVPQAEAKAADSLDLPPFLRQYPHDAPKGKHLCECGKSYVSNDKNFVTVPVHPTTDMLLAGFRAVFAGPDNGFVGRVWSAMLAAKAKGG